MILLPPTSSHDRSLRSPFYTLYFLSLASSVLILGVFTISRLRRHFTIKYLFVALIINAIFNLLPIRAASPPPFSLCVVVAAGTLAGTVLTAGAAAALVFRTWSLVVLSIRISQRVASAINVVCLVLPALAWACVFTGVALSTALRPNNLAVFAFAIVPTSKLDNKAPRVVSLFFLAFVLVFELWTLVYLLHRAKIVTTHTVEGTTSPSLLDGNEGTYRPATFDRAFNLRVLLFGGWLAASVAMVILVLVKGRGNVPAIFQSTGGLCASLIFGSQRDVLEYLHICRKSDSTNSHLPDFVSQGGTRSGFLPNEDSTRRTGMGLNLEDLGPVEEDLRLTGLEVESSSVDENHSKEKTELDSSSGQQVDLTEGTAEDEGGGGLTLTQMLETG